MNVMQLLYLSLFPIFLVCSFFEGKIYRVVGALAFGGLWAAVWNVAHVVNSNAVILRDLLGFSGGT